MCDRPWLGCYVSVRGQVKYYMNVRGQSNVGYQCKRSQWGYYVSVRDYNEGNMWVNQTVRILCDFHRPHYSTFEIEKLFTLEDWLGSLRHISRISWMPNTQFLAHEYEKSVCGVKRGKGAMRYYRKCNIWGPEAPHSPMKWKVMVARPAPQVLIWEMGYFPN